MKRGSRYEWTIVILLTVMWGMVGLNRVGIAYIFPKIVPLFHMAYWQVGLLLSGTSVTWALTSWFGGYLSDLHGRRRVLLPAMAGAGVITALMGVAWNFVSMFVVRDLLGLGDGVGWSVGQATVVEESQPSRRGFNQGLMAGGYTLIGAGLGALIVTRVTASLGWRAVFPIVAVATLVVVAILARVMREPPHLVSAAGEGGAAVRARAGQLFALRPVVILIILNCVILTWLQLSLGFNTLFLTKVRHFSLVEAGTIGSAWGLVGFVGNMTVPYLSDLWGRRRVLAVSAFLCGALMLVYVLGDLSAPLAAAVLAVSGYFGWGSLPIAMATAVAENVPAELHGAAVGVTNFFGVIVGTTVMPIVAGLIADQAGLTATLLIPVIAQFAVVGLAMALPETAPRLLGRLRPASADGPGG